MRRRAVIVVARSGRGRRVHRVSGGGKLSGEREPRRQQHRQRMQHLQRQRRRRRDLRRRRHVSRRRWRPPQLGFNFFAGNTGGGPITTAPEGERVGIQTTAPRRHRHRRSRSPVLRRSTTSTTAAAGAAAPIGPAAGASGEAATPSETDGPFFSNYWGWQMVCGSSSGCNQNAGIALNSVLLTAAEGQGPKLVAAGANNLSPADLALRLEPRRAALSHRGIDVRPLWRVPGPGDRQRRRSSRVPRVSRYLAVAPVPRRILDHRRRRQRRHPRLCPWRRQPDSAIASHQRRPGHDHRCGDAEGR